MEHKTLIARYIARERIKVSIFTDGDGTWTDDYAREVSEEGWLLFADHKKGNFVVPNIEGYKASAIIAQKNIMLSKLGIEEVIALARTVISEVRKDLTQSN